MIDQGRVHTGEELEYLTWTELRDEIQVGKPLLIPVGSLEQHGPHLPLATDSLIAHQLALELAARNRCLVAPPIIYAGYSRPRSGGGRSFPGSVGVPGRVLEDTLHAVVCDFLRHGFRNVAIINGHYENDTVIFDAIEQATRTYHDCKVLLVSWWEQVDNDTLAEVFPMGFPGWEREHASVIETSLMEALLPQLVRAELKADGGAPRVPTYEILPAAEDTIAPTGVLSTAAPASRDIGERIRSLVLDRMSNILDLELCAGQSAAEPPPPEPSPVD